MPRANALNEKLTAQSPETFGRYSLLGRLAIGGMAEVYVARCGELAGMQTLIALKRILPQYARDTKFIQMFQREASIALRLQHRSIARVFEVGKADDDWFLSMELVPGENLARISDGLKERGLRWDPELVAFVGSEAAQALHYAHTLSDARGRPLRIVHRDVSPENIMLGYDGAAKIIDFGIAQSASYASLTTQGAVRGKVQYVSPEQAQSQKPDARSDVFSLGVVLYECLSGSQPFERTSPWETLEAVVHKNVPPVPHVPYALNAAISRALEKDPNNRYPDALAFSKALLKAISPLQVGPDKIAKLTSSLFPKRLARWRKIQDLAGDGIGFTTTEVTPPPRPTALAQPAAQQAPQPGKPSDASREPGLEAAPEPIPMTRATRLTRALPHGYALGDDETEIISHQRNPGDSQRRSYTGLMLIAVAASLAAMWFTRPGAESETPHGETDPSPSSAQSPRSIESARPGRLPINAQADGKQSAVLLAGAQPPTTRAARRVTQLDENMNVLETLPRTDAAAPVNRATGRPGVHADRGHADRSHALPSRTPERRQP